MGLNIFLPYPFLTNKDVKTGHKSSKTVIKAKESSQMSAVESISRRNLSHQRWVQTHGNREKQFKPLKSERTLPNTPILPFLQIPRHHPVNSKKHQPRPFP